MFIDSIYTHVKWLLFYIVSSGLYPIQITIAYWICCIWYPVFGQCFDKALLRLKIRFMYYNISFFNILCGFVVRNAHGLQYEIVWLAMYISSIRVICIQVHIGNNDQSTFILLISTKIWCKRKLMTYRRNFIHTSDAATRFGVGMLYVLRSTDTIYRI